MQRKVLSAATLTFPFVKRVQPSSALAANEGTSTALAQPFVALNMRQSARSKFWEAGGTIAQETRRWGDAKGMSILMRTKEDAQDYRYFPEPDLPDDVVVPEEKIQALKDSIPELPNVSCSVMSLTSDCLRQMPL